MLFYSVIVPLVHMHVPSDSTETLCLFVLARRVQLAEASCSVAGPVCDHSLLVAPGDPEMGQNHGLKGLGCWRQLQKWAKEESEAEGSDWLCLSLPFPMQQCICGNARFVTL